MPRESSAIVPHGWKSVVGARVDGSPIGQQLVRFARLAYESSAEIARALPAMDVIPLDVGSTEAFVARAKDDVVLAFRGTEPHQLEDWLDDLRFRRVKGVLGAPVHRGFLEAWERVRSQVLRALPADDHRRLWITGHSLGGAIAHLAACDLEALAGRRVHRLVTFGEPRVGCWRHAWRAGSRFAGRYDRVVNAGDCVTVVPPLCLGFRHAAPATYLDVDGGVHRGPGVLFRIAAMAIARIAAPVSFAHAVGEYEARLRVGQRNGMKP